MRTDPDFRPFFPRPAPPSRRLHDMAALTLALFPTLFAVISGAGTILVLLLEPAAGDGVALLGAGLLGAAFGWPAAWLTAARILR